MEVRSSGDPGAVGRASQQVVALALAEMAKLRLDAKAYEEAIKLCRESLEIEDTAETRVEIAVASLYAKKVSQAVSEASSATLLDPQYALAWTIEGEALLRAQDYSRAGEALARAIAIKPDTEPLYALGMARLGLGDKDAANTAFTQFLALTGESGWSHVLVGRAYQAQGLGLEAQAEYRKAVLTDPATPNAHYFWALSLMQGNGWSGNAEVLSHLQAELQLNPRHFEANYMLGFLASTARDYKESDQYLRLASEVKPSVPETWVRLGLNAQERNLNRAAEAYFRKAIDLASALDPNEHLEIRKAYVGLGRLLIASSRTKEGQAMLNKASELFAQVLAENQKKFAALKGPEEAEAAEAVAPYIPESDSDHGTSLLPWSTRGTAGENASSRRRAVAHSPTDPQGEAERHLETVLGSSFNDLATAEALQEKYALAWKHYLEAKSWDANIPGLQRNLGLAAYFAGQPSEAIRLLSKIVGESPGDEHARAVLGLSYFAAHDFPKAARTLAPIADQVPQDPQLGFAWAKSLAEIGDKSKAVRALETLEKADKDPDIKELVQFGQLWQKLGERERAEASFRRALLVDPENPEAKCGLQPSKCP
jgi:tetratricopeptide (TPR) repeat protein